jgi:hypothetical protein
MASSGTTSLAATRNLSSARTASNCSTLSAHATPKSLSKHFNSFFF